jgi:sigma54-dependent transcription regulator
MGAAVGDGETSNAISGTVFGHAVQAGYVGTLNLLAPAAPSWQSWQVPAEAPGFVNRTRELADMAGLLDRAADVPLARMVLLIGPPGVGKSELSRRFAARFRDRFPDGGLHVDLAEYRTVGGHVDLGAVFGALLVGLGVSEAAVPASGDARRNLYRAKTHGLKALIVVDDAELAGQVRVLAPASSARWSPRRGASCRS